MKCIICGSKMHYYFSKKFNSYGLSKVDYFKCGNCGFVASKTHYEMSEEEWGKLNVDFHNDNNLREDNPYNRNQRYFNQALMFFLMNKIGFFKKGQFLDWGSGVGSVSKLLDTFFSIDVKNFDKFIKPQLKAMLESKLKKRSYGLVLNNAVFEHVTNRETLDNIESFVTPKGCLAIHTLVPETIPKDSRWMYLLPVHCSFHTNKSMDILMKQWGYKCSVYNEHSKVWVLFKDDFRIVSKRAKALNKILGWDYLKFKKGFMDFWKPIKHCSK